MTIPTANSEIATPVLEPIRYRTGPALDPALSADEEREMLRTIAQNVITQMGATEMLDTLTMYMHVCDTRAMMYANNPQIANWYETLRECLSVSLSVMTQPPQTILPNEKLTDPSLYWPESSTH